MKYFLAYYHQSKTNQLLIDLSFGSILGTVLSFIKMYLFADFEFVKWLAVLMITDTALGVFMAFRTGHISSKGFGMVIKKIMAYGVVLVIIHNLTNFTVNGEKNTLFSWFTQIGYAALIVRESISILENSGKIAPGLIPSWILSRLKDFDKTGKPESLTSNTANNGTSTDNNPNPGI